MIVSQKGMTNYVAPDGHVFDYKEPRLITIKELDGSTTVKEDHLYAKYLTLGRFDSIDNYIVVKDPRSEG